MYPLIDTHTHFDVPEFDDDRQLQSALAYQNGVRHIVLVGFLATYFQRMQDCQRQMREFAKTPNTSTIAHVAFGLHPFYIHQHNNKDLDILESFIQNQPSVAIGEIGLDTFTNEMKMPTTYHRQKLFFDAQLALAKTHKLPILLHIRKSHSDTLALIKANGFDNGGIAHSFSGGIQEAKAFVNLGFKIGITGQITNPNAKKLRTTITELVRAVGIESLVIETDCPDFTPMCCHGTHGRRNTPANLIYVLDELATLLTIDKQTLADKLWHNSLVALPNMLL